MARMINIIEYEDETIIELKLKEGRYQYSFPSWEEAVESMPNLNPELDKDE